MPGVSVTIQGTNNVIARVLNFVHLMNSASLVQQTAEAILEDAQAMCPVRTGNLRDSLNIQYSGSGTQTTAAIGTDVEYAPYVEFGTRYMDAEPFLYPALQMHQNDLQMNIIQMLGF